MASQGPYACGTATNMQRFTNIDNIKVSDNTYTSSTFIPSALAATLAASNFGFSIPTGSTINGIEVSIEKRSGGFTTKDSWLYLVKADSSLSTDNKADTSTFWTYSKMTITYGGPTDTWGSTYTAEEINDSGFYVYFRCNVDTEYENNLGIDFISLKVYYTTGGGSANTGFFGLM